MKIGVVTDSACDLPKDFLDEENVQILPISINVEGHRFVDDRDPGQTLEFYTGGEWTKDHNAESTAFTSDEIRDTFLQHLVLEFDYVFCITISSTRSQIYDNATSASFSILSDYKKVRKEAGIEGPFSLRVIDSKNVFVGQGVLVAEAIRKIKEGASIAEIRTHVSNLIPNLYSYLIPEDLYYIRNRGRQRGEKSVGLFQYAVGSTFDIKPIIRACDGETETFSKGRGFAATSKRLLDTATEQINNRSLKAPTVVVSYGGDPEEVRSMPGYANLERTAHAHNVNLHLTYMSTTAGLYVGAGALALGMAANPHGIKP